MNGLTLEINSCVEDLISVLNKDINHIEFVSSTLSELRALVIKRNENGLRLLLENIRKEAADYSLNEQNRNLIRKKISEFLCCEPNEMTLTFLKKHLSGDQRSAIAEYQNKLKMLVGHLQAQYASTVKLLSECERINTALLKIVFDRGRTRMISYDSEGLAVHDSNAAFMNMHL